MEKLILSTKVKRSISRKVWGLWAARKAVPLAAILAVAVIESTFVSFGDVVANAAGATQNLGALSDYMFSAVVNAELYVLAGAAVFLIGGFAFIRSIVRDLRMVSSVN